MHFDTRELTGLFAFVEEHKLRQAIVVSQDKKIRRLAKHDTTIEIWLWQEFLSTLWADKLI